MLRRHGLRRRWAASLYALVGCLGVLSPARSLQGESLQDVLRGSGAAALVLDAGSGRVLVQTGDLNAAAAPGSTVKPFVLRAALESGAIGEHTTVHCMGTLSVAGHNLACVHPRDVTVLDARQALAESCNTYFAAVARRMPAPQLARAFSDARLRVPAVPTSVEDRELLALGLLDVQASVRELAQAYRSLSLWMEGGEPAARVVREGLIASVETGVAHGAHIDGVVFAGKTGTVDTPGTGRSQGWFAGIVYGAGGQPRQVIVVHVPNGNGRDAAALARRMLEAR